MDETKKRGIDILREKLPIINTWYNVLIIYFLQFSLFLAALYFLWHITSKIWFSVFPAQFFVSFLAIFPLMYITKNSSKIRKKYRKKYGDLAYQQVWYRFLSYNESICSASLYFPILLKTDYFLPAIIQQPSNFMTTSIFGTVFIPLSIGVFLIILGILIRNPGGGFDVDIDCYVYLMYPEESRRIEGGLYQYIRNPRYLGRGLIAIGLGVIANNIVAIMVSLIYFLPYYILIKVEDQEMVKRFGEEFQKRQEKIPALIPNIKDWKKILKILFHKREKS